MGQMRNLFWPMAGRRPTTAELVGNRPPAPRHGVFAAAIGSLFLGACALVRPIDPTPVPALLGYDIPTVADVDLLATSPEMEAFVDRFARSDSEQRSRAWTLAYAALDPYILDFTYDPLVTLPADRAFRARRGNCLTFSSMFVAMARQAGLNAWYQEVEVAPKWSAVNDTVLVSKHVNAVVSEYGLRYAVDVSRLEAQGGERTRRLSDREAKAQYFNNLGVDALVVDDLPLAYAYFDKALETEPGLDYVWSNLGVVFRRNDQPQDAILAYRVALRANPEHAVALNNLHELYTEMGDFDSAAALQQRVERNRRRNPYYLLHLAEEADDAGRWEEAVELLERAIRINAEEYRFYYVLAHAQYHLGQIETARESLEHGRRLAQKAAADHPIPLPRAIDD